MASLNQHKHTRINSFTWNERSTSIDVHLEPNKYIYIYICTYAFIVAVLHTKVYPSQVSFNYGVAKVSRIDKIIGLFCRILSLL